MSYLPFRILLVIFFSITFRTIPLWGQSDTLDHRPHVKVISTIHWYEASSRYEMPFTVTDRDLMLTPGNEKVTIRLLEPEGFTIDYGVHGGTYLLGYVRCPQLPSVSRRLRITIEAADLAGHRDTQSYFILVSDPVLFSMSLIIIDSISSPTTDHAFEFLSFGLATEGRATTGSEPEAPGRLDRHYCEYELPPAPPTGSFDARWVIPGITGAHRNIYPASLPDESPLPPWTARFQASDMKNNKKAPGSILWSRSDAMKAPHPLYMSDPFDKLFRVNMQTGEYVTSPGIVVRRQGRDTMEVQFSFAILDGIKIEQDLTQSVREDEVLNGLRLSFTPNPFSGAVSIDYTLQKQGSTRLEIHNERGDIVRTIINRTEEPGEHRIWWDGLDERGAGCASGTYVCRITVEGKSVARKLILLR